MEPAGVRPHLLRLRQTHTAVSTHVPITGCCCLWMRARWRAAAGPGYCRASWPAACSALLLPCCPAALPAKNVAADASHLPARDSPYPPVPACVRARCRHLASSEGAYQVTEWLLTQQVDVNTLDRFKRTPLEVRCAGVAWRRSLGRPALGGSGCSCAALTLLLLLLRCLCCPLQDAVRGEFREVAKLLSDNGGKASGMGWVAGFALLVRCTGRLAAAAAVTLAGSAGRCCLLGWLRAARLDW